MRPSNTNSFAPVGLLVMLILSSCQAKIEILYDHQTDFSAYHSWCWLQGCEFTFTGPEYLNDSLTRQHIVGAIQDQLARKGLTYDQDNPDLLLDFHVTVTQETTLYHPQYEEDFFRRMELPEAEEIHYLTGTIILDMVDRAKSRMVWRAVVRSDYEMHPELSEDQIRRGLAIALKKFPPKK
jgi:Domain of unknown function (DUF4136)